MAKALAIIPARGGSKRIPRKNLREFNGHPILKYSVDAAIESGLFSEIMVSTDDGEIARHAVAYGAKVPFMRSVGAASDTATTAQVILEVLEKYRGLGTSFEYLCCLYPTAPFVTASKLRVASGMVRSDKVDCVIPVCAFSFPIWRSLRIDGGPPGTDAGDPGAQRLSFNWPEHELTRSQDLPPAYQDCGQFYFMRTAAFLEERRLVMRRTAPLVTSQTEMQDIDNEDDWELAEIKHRRTASRG
jgi:pseudaminic acid cytidylyltransferase